MSAFKLGDRVRCVRGSTSGDLLLGETYIIDHVTKNGFCSVIGLTNSCSVDRFELVGDVERTVNPFNVGDRVRVVKPAIGPYMEGHDMRVGDIHTIESTYLQRTGAGERAMVRLAGMPDRWDGWFANRFELAVPADFWDPARHTRRPMVTQAPFTYEGAAFAVLLLINVVQHMQPRWVERPPATVMVELPRSYVAEMARTSWRGAVLGDACRAAEVRDGAA